MSVHRNLTEAEAALRRGRSELLAGRSGVAAESFAAARSRFAGAADTTSGPVLGAVGWIPILGRNVDAVTAVSAAGERVADAGGSLARAVDRLPGGLSALAPEGGRVPLERFDPLGAAIAQAWEASGSALEVILAAPDDLLLGPVSAAIEEAEEEVRSLNLLLGTGTRLVEGLPGLLGDEGPRRYFFGAQNPAELRGTGGVMGAYAILTIDDGRFRFSRFAPVQSLPRPDLPDVPPPSEEFARNYDAFRGDDRFWLAINLTPDFPSAAEAILNAYEVTEGERLDGVILADPFALEALLRVTGPAYVARLDRSVAASDVVAFTTNEAYALYPDPATRKRVLGEVAKGVFEAFVARAGTDVADLRILAEAASEGHLLVYSDDEPVQAGLVATGAGGAFSASTGDLLSIVENSSAGTKVDYYEDRTVRYEVDLWEDGAARATVRVALHNSAPTSGVPRYVIGPNPGFAAAGEGGQLLSIYCGPGCRLEEARRDDARIGVWAGSELGHRFYRDYFGTRSGETSELEVSWHLPTAWEGDGTGGTYRLTFLNQATIRPADVTVVVHAPDGMQIHEASPGMTVDGDSATWEGTPARSLELTVEFEPPLLVRLWRGLTS